MNYVKQLGNLGESRPFLFSYRRCPYAMRARMALLACQIDFDIQEISLKDKPGKMLNISPKGTVPVLVYKDLVLASSSDDLFTLPIVKPLREKIIVKKLLQYKEIIIVEEHQLIGGLGSAIQEILFDYYSSSELATLPRIHRVGIKDTFQSVAGNQDFLRDKAGLFSYRRYI